MLNSTILLVFNKGGEVKIALVFVALAVALVIMKLFRGRGQKLVCAMQPAGKWRAMAVASLEKVNKPCPCCLASADNIVPVELTSIQYFPGSKNFGKMETINAWRCIVCGALLVELPTSDHRESVILS